MSGNRGQAPQHPQCSEVLGVLSMCTLEHVLGLEDVLYQAMPGDLNPYFSEYNHFSPSQANLNGELSMIREEVNYWLREFEA